jgi:hypothetical protein
MNAQQNMLEDLLSRLDADKGRWPEISRASGVPYFTMMKLVQRRTRNPQIKTVQALVDYYGRTESK